MAKNTQQRIAGTQSPEEAAVDTVARDYVKKLHSRQKLQGVENVVRQELAELMVKNKVSRTEVLGTEVLAVEGEVKIKTKKLGD